MTPKQCAPRRTSIRSPWIRRTRPARDEPAGSHVNLRPAERTGLTLLILMVVAVVLAAPHRGLQVLDTSSSASFWPAP